MTRHRRPLPQLDGGLFLADGGLETTLIFHDGLDLPLFAAFPLLQHDAGRAALRRYFERYATLARDHGVGIVLETPTWRASRDWAGRLGHSPAALAQANRDAVALVADVRARHETPRTPIVVSANVGPRGDGYRADARMSIDEATHYHREQIETFATTDADMVAAFTMTYVEEAIGVTRAAEACAMPVAISFTVETDGRLPSGQRLGEAIEATDHATVGAPVYYLINCAHPAHFADTLDDAGPWTARVRGLRANASMRSHAELDACTDLDAGDPVALAREYRALHDALPQLCVMGGCCGTDHRHVDAIARAVLAPRMRAGAAAIGCAM
jgi:S-methylmethionine-dependent homocysteine/selenocysteine methylase